MHQVREVRAHEHGQEVPAVRQGGGRGGAHPEHRPGPADPGDAGRGSRHALVRLGHEQGPRRRHRRRHAADGRGGADQDWARARGGQGGGAQEHEQGGEEGVAEETGEDGQEEKEEGKEREEKEEPFFRQ